MLCYAHVGSVRWGLGLVCSSSLSGGSCVCLVVAWLPSWSLMLHQAFHLHEFPSSSCNSRDGAERQDRLLKAYASLVQSLSPPRSTCADGLALPIIHIPRR